MGLQPVEGFGIGSTFRGFSIRTFLKNEELIALSAAQGAGKPKPTFHFGWDGLGYGLR
jgi:hypothetical protein